jgi:hypothetical protein
MKLSAVAIILVKLRKDVRVLVKSFIASLNKGMCLV